MENNTMVLNGQKYRLIPVKANWEINLICPTEMMPNCPLGHNGTYLPKNHEILGVRLGNENFEVGDTINEGVIEKFIYDNTCRYVYAKIKGVEKYVDVDQLKKM